MKSTENWLVSKLNKEKNFYNSKDLLTYFNEKNKQRFIMLHFTQNSRQH